MKRRRRSSSGKYWSAKEDRILERFYPQYQEILKRLKDRSYWAIRNRARSLGIVTERHIWTNREIAKLQALYARGATRAEVSRQFPHLRSSQICAKAGHIRLVRARNDPYKLGVGPLDDIRKKAVAQGLTWRQLDKIAGTGRYFQQTTRRVDWEHISRAIEKLGGTIEITWS